MKKKFLFILFCTYLFAGNIFAVDTFKYITINGKISDNYGNGVPSVDVTDGNIITKTDSTGFYTLKTLSNKDYVYYSLPSGYLSTTKNYLPQFYKKIDKSKNVQEINFTINKSKVNQTKHSFIIWADPQVSTKEEFKLLQEVADDVKKTVSTLPNFSHAISVGDNVFDKHNLIEQYIETVSTMQVPFYHTLGNHDMDYNERSNALADKTYCSYFGPSHYSFNVGKVHYIVLNDVFYYGYTYRYIGYITEEQLHWLEQDLTSFQKGGTVVVSLHIPTMFDKAKKARSLASLMTSSVMNNKALYNVLKDYNVHIMSGHSHVQWNTQIASNVLEHTHAAACGAWWQGDVCTDGTPKGYTVYEVNGDSLSWYFKGLDKEKTDQFRLYLEGDTLCANVFNYDNKWRLEYYEDGKFIDTLQQYLGVDPLAKAAYQKGKNKRYSWLSYHKTGHLFRTIVKNKSAELKVIAIDRFGNKYIKKISPYKLVWNDEFDYNGLPNKKKWSYDVKGNSYGWGNNEKQYYTKLDKSNSIVNNGTLKIIARRRDVGGKHYTSARLITKDKGDWQYGRVEVRAKLPSGRGSWPAIWMLPTKNLYGKWPNSGEIDIMENVGYAVDTIISTIHTKKYNHILNTQESKKVVEKTASSQFHIYSMEWDQYKLKTYIDDRLINVWRNDNTGYASWPFNSKFYLILNLAIGGNWGGKQGIDDSLFPKTFEIDYVRVYQR